MNTSVWHSSCFLFGIVVNQITLSNCKISTMSFSMHSRNSAIIRLWAIIVHNSFFTCFNAEMFVHQLHSFQSCTDKFSVQYPHLDTLLADCWHAMLALHLELFGFSVLTRSEEVNQFFRNSASIYR